MRVIAILLFSCLNLCAQVSAQTHERVYRSGEQQVTLLEIYSSQGCSSCPPAERWVSLFDGHEALWQQVVPLVFHVDYWNDLGWKDPFSSVAYSRRQRQFKRQGHSNSVYTPGFLVNGEEWRGWFRAEPLSYVPKLAAQLTAQLTGRELMVTYDGFEQGQVANVAVLGFDLQTLIRRGENRNVSLRQDFVVLSHTSVALNNEGISMKLQAPDHKAPRYGLAVWVSQHRDLRAIQATGGDLPDIWQRDESARNAPPITPVQAGF